MWPVLQRELREQARQGGTYWLRVLAGGVVLLLFWLAWEREANGGQLNGRGYFLGLHRLLFLGIWFLAPVLTADCLSRERREGTLGLLFLTPLRPVDVVVGKAFVHVLRGLVFVLAAVPIMVIPVLMGGVSWLDAVRMFLLELAALGLALVSGLTASAVTESWWRARLLAFLLAIIAAALFFALYLGLQWVPGWWRSLWNGTPGTAVPWDALWDQFLARQGFYASQGFNGLWIDWTPLAAGWPAVRTAFWVWVCSWILVALTARLAAVGVSRTWRSEPPSARRQEVARWLTEVQVAGTWWRKRRAEALTANPIRWLQSRTWSARVGGWALLGLALAIAGTAIDVPRSSAEGLYFMGRVLLLGGVAFAAAASFRQERENGALELWLVTPLAPEAMVRGRLGGLATRFLLPSLILLFLPQIRFGWRWYLASQDPQFARPGYWVMPPVEWMFALWVAATVVFGVGLSLSRLSFLTTFALAWVAHHAPFVVTALLDWANDEAGQKFNGRIPWWNSDSFYLWFSILLAMAVTSWGAWFARRQLAERRFVPGWCSVDLSVPAKPREVTPA